MDLTASNESASFKDGYLYRKLSPTTPVTADAKYPAATFHSLQADQGRVQDQRPKHSQHAKGKSAWQSAFFLKEVRVELSGEAASVKCSPPEIPLAPAQLMQSCNILFSLIVNLDSSVVIKCDPPIHPTFINEWDAKRRQFAVDHGGIRSFTERQTTVYY